MRRKNRDARKQEQAEKRQAQKQQQMQHPRGTSSYAQKKKSGPTPTSPFYKDPNEEKPQAQQASWGRRTWGFIPE